MMDGHIARTQAGTTQCSARGCGHRRTEAIKPGPLDPPVWLSRAGKHSSKNLGLFPWDVLNSGHSREICSPAAARFSAGCWALHRAGAAAALGREHNHLFPSPAHSASQAANWDNSPRHKQLDKRSHPPRQGGRGGKQRRSKHSEYLPSTAGQTPHSCLCLPPSVHPWLSPRRSSRLPGKTLGGLSLQHTPPQLCPRSSARHGRSYSSGTHLWLQTAASRSADSVNLCHLLPCLPGQLQ